LETLGSRGFSHSLTTLFAPAEGLGHHPLVLTIAAAAIDAGHGCR
jgi:hypothetical protein